jgi:NAD(P)-dependent dehydrogenase (short-subunit alcohol dehydrogenase family)
LSTSANKTCVPHGYAYDGDAAGFVDTPLSASLLGDQLENRRNQLRSTLPIRRVVGPADITALVVHLMTNTAVTGATYDNDGGQLLVDE